MKLFKLRRIAALCLAGGIMLMSLGACQSSESTASTATSSASTAASSGSAGSGDTLLEKIKQKGYILIGSSNDAPFAYQDADTGALKGLDIEILQEACKRLGIPKVQLKVIDFSNLLLELNNNNIDMVADAMYVKDDRLQVAAFSDKWYQEGEAVVIPSNSTIKSKDDLKGKTVGAQPGTTFYTTAQQWKEDGKIGKLVSYDNQATLMTAVNMGKVDAVVTDGIVAGYTLSTDSSLKLKLLSPYQAEASGQIGAAVRFKDEDFLTDFNKVLNDMKTDGTLLKILKNFGLTEDYFVGVDAGKTKNVK